MRKPAFCICENKGADHLRSAFVFATRIIQSLFFLNTEFQASSHLLWLYSPISEGPGQKTRRPICSHRGSNVSAEHQSEHSTMQMRKQRYTCNEKGVIVTIVTASSCKSPHIRVLDSPKEAKSSLYDKQHLVRGTAEDHT